MGSWYGSVVPPRDLPMLAHLLGFGELRLEPMIARTIPLDGIHDALVKFETGDEARSVIVYDSAGCGGGKPRPHASLPPSTTIVVPVM